MNHCFARRSKGNFGLTEIAAPEEFLMKPFGSADLFRYAACSTSKT